MHVRSSCGQNPLSLSPLYCTCALQKIIVDGLLDRVSSVWLCLRFHSRVYSVFLSICIVVSHSRQKFQFSCGNSLMLPLKLNSFSVGTLARSFSLGRCDSFHATSSDYTIKWKTGRFLCICLYLVWLCVH